MSVKQELNGTWTTSISYFKDGVARHTHKRGFRTKREAHRYEIDFRDGLKNIPNLKFEDALDSFLKDKKTNRKKSTNDELTRICRDYFNDLLPIQIKNLKIRNYQQIKDALSNTELSTSYKNKIITILKSISKYISLHYEANDAARGITKFKSFEIKEEMQTWTPSEFAFFLKYVDREIYRDLFHTLYYTGARIGEIRALYKSDLIDNYISITKSIRHEIDGITSPKNQYSIRKVTLDSSTLEILNKYSKMKGLFLFGNDKPLSESSIGRIFRGYIKVVQDTDPSFKKLRIHDLRHSHATSLINNGANIVAVSKRLGHANIEITLKTYTHLFKENELKLIEIIENIKY